MFPATRFLQLAALEHNAMKASHRYAVQGSDTTMLPKAASLPEQ